MGQTVFGIFGEFSSGDYETFAYIPRYGDVFGDGDVKTFGGGLFVKNIFPSDTVVELTFRGGGVRNEFRMTRDPWAANPGVHNAKTDSSYMGGHIGVAQMFDLTEAGRLEAYGRYFLTHMPSDTFTTNFGDPITIDSFDSSRIRLGGRYTQTLPTESLQLYFGLAAEQEFDGKVTGRNGPDPFLHSVDMSGTSGFGELGLDFKPTEELTLSIGAFGWAGRQKGAGGNVAVNFSF
jgi:outer membrane autotransporter protein